MPVCDVCNKTMNWEEGYVLTTKQVTTSESYWVSAFKGVWSHAHSMDPGGDSVGMLVKQQAAQSSGWLVCESCSGNFSFDRGKASTYAKSRNGNPPGTGPASAEAVASAAANAWKSLYGVWPSSIQIAGRMSGREKKGSPAVSKQEQDSSCFVATAVYGKNDCFQLSILRRFRDEILLNSFIGKNFVRFYYRIGPHVAANIKDRPVIRCFTKQVVDSIVFVLKKIR